MIFVYNDTYGALKTANDLYKDRRLICRLTLISILLLCALCVRKWE